jgi:hypothetical protein
MTKNTVEQYMRDEDYGLASESEHPENACRDCSALFMVNGATRCYAYEQQRFKDADAVFTPAPDCNCNLFDDTGMLTVCAAAYKKALDAGADPETDPEYQRVLKEENERYKSRFAASLYDEEEEAWDADYWTRQMARCYDWQDEPESCYACSDDDCPLNKS